MQKFLSIVRDREDWLVERIIRYSTRHNHVNYSSTLAEAWWAVIRGLSGAMGEAFEGRDTLPPLRAHTTGNQATIAEFGIEQARRHRARGVTLGQFLSRLKYYKQAYVDLLDECAFDAAETRRNRRNLERFFDIIEIGVCTEWSGLNESEKLAEARDKNRQTTNEKNEYLTIFESLRDPVVLLDHRGQIVNMNNAACALFASSSVPGALYYGDATHELLDSQLADILKNASDDYEFERDVETHQGIRCFGIKLRCMLDFSEKFEGKVLIFNDITERKRAQEAAERANKAKSDFLTTMSHELRTPMNGILGTARYLQKTSLSNEQQTYIEVLIQSGDALLSILNDILDFSKIEAGGAGSSLEMSTFDLWSLLDSMVSLMVQPAKEKGLTLKLEAAGNVPPSVKSDPGKIRQILLNLIGNAIKFTQKGSVCIRVETDGVVPSDPPMLRISIEDTGIGIPEGMDKILFEPFTQAEEPDAVQHYGGTGLGLAICKRLVTMLGGTIGFDRLPNGTRFWFTIPIVTAEAIRVYDDDAIARDKHTQKMNILLVEDNEVNQLVAEGFLRRQGHTVTTMRCGEEALKAAETAVFDIILMDIRMPGIDGVETLRRLRAQKNGANAETPCIAMTAHARKSKIQSFLKSNFDGYLGKPFNPEDMARVLAQFSGGKQGGDLIAETMPTSDILINVDVVTHLYETLGIDATKKTVTLFKDTGAEITSVICNGGKDDPQTLIGAAHKLKSASGSLGLEALRRIAESIEKAAEDDDLDAVQNLSERLPDVFRQSTEALDEIGRNVS